MGKRILGMNQTKKKTPQDFIRDRAQIQTAFRQLASTADAIKQKILLKNPHAFDRPINKNPGLMRSLT